MEIIVRDIKCKLPLVVSMLGKAIQVRYVVTYLEILPFQLYDMGSISS